MQILAVGGERKPKAFPAVAGSSASASLRPAWDMEITPMTDLVMAVTLVPYSGIIENSEGFLTV